MEQTSYTKIFHGNFILVTRIKAALEAQGIVPVIKDEGESQRLAGFGSLNQGFQEVFVNNEELKKAETIVAKIKVDIENT